MARYSGMVGFATAGDASDPDVPFLSVNNNEIVEHKMLGDILRASYNYTAMDHLYAGAKSDNVFLQHRISLIGDKFSMHPENRPVYITFKGAKWKIAAVEYSKPRLIVTLGDKYHED